MKLTLALFAALLVVIVALKIVTAAKNYGVDVEARFVERLKYIPSKTTGLLTRENLAAWIDGETNAKAVSAYVIPVLFPLDLLFLLLLGCFLGAASTALVARLPMLANIPTAIWWVLPLLYLVADLAEDSLMAGLFKHIIQLDDTWFGVLRILTAIKINSVTAAIGQVGFLAALWGLLRLYPMSRG